MAGFRTDVVIGIGIILFISIFALAFAQTTGLVPGSGNIQQDFKNSFAITSAYLLDKIPKSYLFQGRGEIRCRDERGCRFVKENAEIYLEYGTGLSFSDDTSDFQPVSTSRDSDVWTHENPAECVLEERPEGYLVCISYWDIIANKPGNYALRMNVKISDNNIRTEEIPINVVPGRLEAAINIDPLHIEKGEESNISSAVNCYDADCPDISVFLRYNDINIPEGDELTITDSYPNDNINPEVCTTMSIGGTCQVWWIVRAHSVGEYNITAFSKSKDSDINPVTSPHKFLSVSESAPLVGELQLLNILTTPPRINASQISNFSARINCTTEDCGNVNLFASYNGNNLNNIGDVSTENGNPQSCQIFPCEVSWIINGNKPGNYRIELYADSDNTDDIQGYSNLAVDNVANITLNETPIQNETLVVGLLNKTSVVWRGESFLVWVNVTKNNSAENSANVIASSSGFFAFSLNPEGNGLYSGEFSITNDYPAKNYNVIITAKKEPITSSLETGFAVNASLNIDLKSDRVNYSVFDKVLINILAKKKQAPVTANVTINLNCPSHSRQLQKGVTNSVGSYNFEFSLDERVPSGVCIISATVVDEYKNSGNDNVEISILRSEKQKYIVSFLNPRPQTGPKFEKGETIDIELNITSDEKLVSDARVFCEGFSNGKDAINLTEIPDRSYIGNYSIPANYSVLEGELETWSIYCVAKTADDSFGNGFIGIDLFEFKDGQENQGSVTNNIGDKGTLPDRKEIDVFPLFAAMIIIGAALIVITILLVTRSKYGNGTYRPATTSPAKQVYDRRDMYIYSLRKLEARKNTLEKAKSAAEISYFTRKIDERTFKRLMEEYEKDIIKLNVMIIEVKRQLSKLA